MREGRGEEDAVGWEWLAEDTHAYGQLFEASSKQEHL